jgi:hypothetical protein
MYMSQSKHLLRKLRHHSNSQFNSRPNNPFLKLSLPFSGNLSLHRAY